MKKRIMVASILSSIVAISCVACANVKKNDSQNMSYTTGLYNNQIDYTAVINDYIVNNKDLSDMEYKQAVYMLLNSTNIPMDEYKSELHDMLLYSMHPGCISDEFNNIFANLIMTLQNNELDPQVREETFRVYLSLASYLHEMECHDKSHIEDYNPDMDVYKCDTLNAELKRSR